MSVLPRTLLLLGLASSVCGLSWAQDAAGQDGCDQVAAGVFEACIGLGNDETSCAQLRDVAFQVCTEAFPPGPQPGPCEILCEGGARQVFEDCLAAGGSTEECGERSAGFLRHCLEGCEVEPPPVPCEVQCDLLRQEKLRSCGAADGQVDPACWQEVEAQFNACLAGCGNQPPPPDDCFASCQRRFDEFLNQCLAGTDPNTGNDPATGGDPNECHLQAQRILEDCMASCQGTPPPDCPTSCEQVRQQILGSCATAAGEVDPECEQMAEEAYRACLAGCENQPPPDDCFSSCQRRFDEFLNQCLAGTDPGGANDPATGDDPNECHLQAQRILEDCMASCQWVPPPPPPDCPTGCELIRQQILVSCATPDNRLDPECEQRAEEAYQACLAGCENQPPPPEDCATSCQRRFDEFLNQCLGGTDPNTGNDPAAGDDPNECHARAQQILQECMASCDATTPPSSCEERCKVSSEVVFQECLQTNGSAEECAARMAEYAEACLLRCGQVEPPPPPIECPELCEARGQEMLSMCLARNLDPAECESRRATFVEECAAQCDHGGAASCEDLCASSARQSVAACLESGGDPDACRQRADRILAACMTTCNQSPPSTCDQGCGDRARSLLSSCLEEGRSPEECRKETNDFLERCLAGCGAVQPPEAPSCADRCAESTRLLLRECVDRGGDEAECRAAAEPFLAECLQMCKEPAPEPVPCDQPCEEIADGMRLRCTTAAGVVDPACLAAVDAFLAQCRDSTQAVCDRNEEGMGAAPVMFLRGDFNRDRVANISDSIGILGYLFLGKPPTPCEDAADANDDGQVNLSDPIALLNHLFRGAGDLPAPCGSEGHDPTSDGLICSP